VILDIYRNTEECDAFEGDVRRTVVTLLQDPARPPASQSNTGAISDD